MNINTQIEDLYYLYMLNHSYDLNNIIKQYRDEMGLSIYNNTDSKTELDKLFEFIRFHSSYEKVLYEKMNMENDEINREENINIIDENDELFELGGKPQTKKEKRKLLN